MIPVNKVFFEQVFMNLTLWVWGRYGLAVSALILLGVPAVAAPSKGDRPHRICLREG